MINSILIKLMKFCRTKITLCIFKLLCCLNNWIIYIILFRSNISVCSGNT
nr:MAG TPA: hypothetical protein [Caudoviricetes sp.]DAU59332.1 MAG TPA: hypothetical protein [Crassvirales sp.]